MVHEPDYMNIGNQGVRQRGIYVSVLGLCLIIFVGIADYLTGHAINVALFYLIPILFVTWFGDSITGLTAAVISSAVWFTCDRSSGHVYANEYIPYWNAAIHLGVFVVFSILLTKFRTIKERLELEIIEHKAVKADIEKSEEKYRSLVESTEDSIYVLDRTCKYSYINKKHLLRLGILDNHYTGRSYGDYHSIETTRDFTELVERVFQTGDSIEIEHNRSRDDECFLLTLSPVKDSLGNTTAVTVISKRITELKRMEKELRDLSLTDELTGLHNRRGLFALIEQYIKIVSRQKTKLYILYVDLDNLKSINDTYGHHAGDNILKQVAVLLRETFRESDIVARAGGDEFVIIPIGFTCEVAEAMTARLEENLRRHNSKGHSEYALALSYGIACYDPDQPRPIEELLAQADQSMYNHKKNKSAVRGTLRPC